MNFIGRGNDCNIRTSNRLVSRKHCSILVFNDKVEIKDEVIKHFFKYL